MMIAQVSDLKPGLFIHTLGDAHLYRNHSKQAKEQLQRKPKMLPTMEIEKNIKCLFDFRYEHFELKNYDPHPRIPAPIAI